MVTAVPSRCTSLAGNRSRSSHSGAASPRRIAAVLAAFASTQVAAATLAARQQDSTGSPVRGAMMWCSLIPPRCQDRTPVLEVASPLSEITIA